MTITNDTALSAYLAECRRRAVEVRKLTGWDLPDNWGIGPVSTHRDADALTESNWETAIEILNDRCGDAANVAAVASDLDDDDPACWDVAHFGHFAFGWIDEIAFRMDGPAAQVAFELAERLDGYPVLNEDDYSRREWESDHPGDGYCYSEGCREDGECGADADNQFA